MLPLCVFSDVALRMSGLVQRSIMDAFFFSPIGTMELLTGWWVGGMCKSSVYNQ